MRTRSGQTARVQMHFSELYTHAKSLLREPQSYGLLTWDCSYSQECSSTATSGSTRPRRCPVGSLSIGSSRVSGLPWQPCLCKLPFDYLLVVSVYDDMVWSKVVKVRSKMRLLIFRRTCQLKNSYMTNAIPASVHPDLGLQDYIGIALWGSGFAFQVIANYQKQKWRKEVGRDYKRSFISTGLWYVALMFTLFFFFLSDDMKICLLIANPNVLRFVCFEW